MRWLTLSIEGKGAPGGEEFQAKISALYSLAYSIKMLMKKKGKDFTVAKLEGLWWVDSDKTWQEVPREEWRWKLLIRQPEFVNEGIVERERKETMKKRMRESEIEMLKEVKFEKMDEGRCAQILHFGPYANEPRILGKDVRVHEGEGARSSRLPPRGLPFRSEKNP